MIYFIEDPSTHRIKIGTTIRLTSRLAALRAKHGSQLQVLGVVSGSYADERVLHERFHLLRDEGEWFRAHDLLIAFVDRESQPWDGTDEIADFIRHARIELPGEDYQRLKAAADRYHISVAGYIRIAVMERIERDEAKGSGSK